MPVEDLIRTLKTNQKFSNHVVKITTIPATPARYGDLSCPLPEPIEAYLKRRGWILYTHQCEAIERVRNGDNIIITTSTASGKTLAFNAPVLERMIDEPGATALYIYPGKALANDQLKTLLEMEEECGIPIHPAKYDNDVVDKATKRDIRENSKIVITNQHKIHFFLAWHRQWERFFRNLRFIVIDEVHTYRGNYGARVAQLIRRIKRVCRHYGSNPQFIMSSATIANPVEFAETFIGEPCVLIDNDGSPRGNKYFVLYNPQGGLADGEKPRTPNTECVDMMLECVRYGLQTICFTKTRGEAELCAKYANRNIRQIALRVIKQGEAASPDDVAIAQIEPGTIVAYRSGYDQDERKDIEDKLKRGEIRGVFSTNALEVGIDVGSLDVIIMCGYPRTMMSTWQQAGRAGRGKSDSVAILVASNQLVDQFYMRNPDAFFAKSSEYAVVDPMNPLIIRDHILCAANELPITEDDVEYFGDSLIEMCDELVASGELKKTPRGYVYAKEDFPPQRVALNQTSPQSFNVMCDGKVIEVVSHEQAVHNLYPGAVYNYRQTSYVVASFSYRQRCIVLVKRDNIDYHTTPIMNMSINIVNVERHKVEGGIDVYYGDVEVIADYVGYRKIWDRTDVPGESGSSGGMIPLQGHGYSYVTKATWFTIPDAVAQNPMVYLRGMSPSLGVYGLKNLITSVIPLYLMCDRSDIGGAASEYHEDTLRGTVFLYDVCSGGSGLVEKAYDLIISLIQRSGDILEVCECKDGCPQCIMSSDDNRNEITNKTMTLHLCNLLRHHVKTHTGTREIPQESGRVVG